MMNQEMISKLESMGGKRWQKGNMDRIYFNAATLGLTCTYHKTGSISSAMFGDEEISNNHAGKLKAAKTYVDVERQQIVSDSALLAAALADRIGAEYSYGETLIKM